MSQVILFDLDGTLTASGEGITKCVQYALGKMGIVENDLKKLECFIGPPLKDSFMKYGGLTEEQAVEAIAHYRERYEEIGIFENSLYSKVPELLELLQINNKIMGVASSKPEKYVKLILEYFEIASYFREIVGSDMDGKKVTKAEVIEEALVRLNMQTERDKVIMVGDRAEDVLGATSCGIQCVGAVYGYGGAEELKQAGAVYLAETVEDLAVLASPNDEETTEHVESIRQLDLKEPEESMAQDMVSPSLFHPNNPYLTDAKEIVREVTSEDFEYIVEEKKYSTEELPDTSKLIEAIQNMGEPVRKKRRAKSGKMHPLHHIWRWIYPMLLYFVVSIAVTLSTGIYFAVQLLASSENYNTEILMNKIAGSAIVQTLITNIVISFICWLLYRIDQKRRERGIVGKGKTPRWTPAKVWLAIVVISVSGAQFFNDLINVFELDKIFPTYSNVSEQIFAGQPVWLLLLTICVAAPIAEEFIFRGLLCHRMKDWFNPWIAIVLSGFMFGLYHGNMIQFIYAFLMGIVFGIIYHRAGTLRSAIVAHLAANLWSMSGYVILSEFSANLPVVRWILLVIFGLLLILPTSWLIVYKHK